MVNFLFLKEDQKEDFLSEERHLRSQIEKCSIYQGHFDENLGTVTFACFKKVPKLIIRSTSQVLFYVEKSQTKRVPGYLSFSKGEKRGKILNRSKD